LKEIEEILRIAEAENEVEIFMTSNDISDWKLRRKPTALEA
jgi:hypothetical protein